MDGSLRRARILTIHLAIVNIEISVRSRRTHPTTSRLTICHGRNCQDRALAREREATLTRWTLGS